MQSTVAQVDADFNTAKLQADRDAALAKEGLVQRGGRQNLRGEGAGSSAAAWILKRNESNISASAEEAQLAVARE